MGAKNALDATSNSRCGNGPSGQPPTGEDVWSNWDCWPEEEWRSFLYEDAWPDVWTEKDEEKDDERLAAKEEGRAEAREANEASKAEGAISAGVSATGESKTLAANRGVGEKEAENDFDCCCCVGVGATRAAAVICWRWRAEGWWLYGNCWWWLYSWIKELAWDKEESESGVSWLDSIVLEEKTAGAAKTDDLSKMIKKSDTKTKKWCAVNSILDLIWKNCLPKNGSHRSQMWPKRCERQERSTAQKSARAPNSARERLFLATTGCAIQKTTKRKWWRKERVLARNWSGFRNLIVKPNERVGS